MEGPNHRTKPELSVAKTTSVQMLKAWQLGRDTEKRRFPGFQKNEKLQIAGLGIQRKGFQSYPLNLVVNASKIP